MSDHQLRLTAEQNRVDHSQERICVPDSIELATPCLRDNPSPEKSPTPHKRARKRMERSCIHASAGSSTQNSDSPLEEVLSSVANTRRRTRKGKLLKLQERKSTSQCSMEAEILKSTDGIFFSVQNAAYAVTIKDILLMLRDEYGAQVIRQYKTHIRNRLKDLITTHLVDRIEQPSPKAWLFPRAVPTEVIEILDDSDDDVEAEKDDHNHQLMNEDDEDDSVRVEKTLSCMEIVRIKFIEAQATNQVICLD